MKRGSSHRQEARGLVIRVVTDNAARGDMIAEHGLSFWIEMEGHAMLFDAGQGPAFAKNAAGLGLPLMRAEAVVVSHGHYDHTGGLRYLMACAPKARCFLHPLARRDRYSRHPDGSLHAIGMPPDVRAGLSADPTRAVMTETPTEILPGVWATGPIPRRSGEDVGGDFFLDAECRTPDPVLDEQALWIETRGGIVVLLGCGHAGVVNTLDHISALAGTTSFLAVLGGMHLRRASGERLELTLRAFERYGVRRVIPGHCTGAAAVAAFRGCFGERCADGAAGSAHYF